MNRFRELFVVLALTLVGCSSSSSGDAGGSMETELTSGVLFSACDGWSFSNLEQSGPKKIAFIKQPGVFNVLATTIDTSTVPEANRHTSADLLNLHYVGCFREVGRTSLDIECPMQFTDGTDVTPSSFELEVELVVVDAATGVEVATHPMDAPFNNCPFGAQVLRDDPQLYGEIDLELAAQLVAPLLDG